MIRHGGFLTNKRAGLKTGIAQQSLVFHLVLVAFLVAETLAGSRMIEPPTRPSLWRYGFGTPVNFNDDEIKCGGFDRQYGANDGKCGVCGDPWTDPTPRRYEAGGTGTATPTPLPVRVYNKGSDIFVAIDSSSDLVGKYEFRICKLNSSNQTPDQSCFDATPLPIKEAELGLSYRIGQSGGLKSLHLVLPANLVCSHCLLQWRHVTGNRVGSESCVQCSATSTPQCNFCLGCGNQSWYQGCSDIAVIDTGGTHPAVLGVKSNSELKQQWQNTLQEIKDNCTCTASPGGENLINGSYPYTASTTTDFSSLTNSSGAGLTTAGAGLMTTEAGLMTTGAGLMTTGAGLTTTGAGLTTAGAGLMTTGASVSGAGTTTPTIGSTIGPTSPSGSVSDTTRPASQASSHSSTGKDMATSITTPPSVTNPPTPTPSSAVISTRSSDGSSSSGMIVPTPSVRITTTTTTTTTTTRPTTRPTTTTTTTTTTKPTTTTTKTTTTTQKPVINSGGGLGSYPNTWINNLYNYNPFSSNENSNEYNPFGNSNGYFNGFNSGNAWSNPNSGNAWSNPSYQNQNGFFYPGWQRPTPRPTTPKPTTPAPARVCYQQFRPPWYVYDANTWCVRNCPGAGSVCNYQTCRPVRCSPMSGSGSVEYTVNNGNSRSWLLPLLFMSEAFEL